MSPPFYPRSCSTSCLAGRWLKGRCQFSRAPPAGSPWYCATRCPTPRTPHLLRWCPSGPPSSSTGTPTLRTQVREWGQVLSLLAQPTSSHFRLLPVSSEPPPPPPQERAHRPPPEAPPACAPPCAPPLSPSVPGPWDQEVVVCIQPSRSASPPEGADETHKVRQNWKHQY